MTRVVTPVQFSTNGPGFWKLEWVGILHEIQSSKNFDTIIQSSPPIWKWIRPDGKCSELGGQKYAELLEIKRKQDLENSYLMIDVINKRNNLYLLKQKKNI